MNESEEGWPRRVVVPPDVDLDRAWAAVAARVWQRRVGPAERAAGRLLRSPALARALLTTPSLLLPWLIATVGVFGAGIAATFGTHQMLVALVAPAVAGAGIAFAYGPGVDPAWELSQTMAVSDRMVLLVRGLAVFSTNAAFGLAATAISRPAATVTFDWLLPMTAVSALALAVATLARSAPAGALAGGGCWAIAVLSGRAISGRFLVVVTDTSLFVPYLALAVLCLAGVLATPHVPKGSPS
jgi:hypothetical protein